jgi:hypothetical protein
MLATGAGCKITLTDQHRRGSAWAAGGGRAGRYGAAQQARDAPRPRERRRRRHWHGRPHCNAGGLQRANILLVQRWRLGRADDHHQHCATASLVSLCSECGSAAFQLEYRSLSRSSQHASVGLAHYRAAGTPLCSSIPASAQTSHTFDRGWPTARRLLLRCSTHGTL